MKKAIVLSVLGIAASGMAAFGQGAVNFDNYVSSTFANDQVLWGALSGHTVGTPVLSGSVEVQLFYQLGTINTDAASFAASATAGITGFVNPGITYGGSAGSGGYFEAGTQLINGWSSTTAPTVTFMYEAWDTTTGSTFAAATVKGYSALWQEGPAATPAANGIQPTSQPATYFANSPGVTLTGVPEPTTMALGGLGLASLLVLRRKKA